MKAVKKIYHRIKLNPLHTVLGSLMIVLGIVLLINDSFFYWPPELQWFFNNDLVDAFAIITGTGLIAFVLIGGQNQLANAVLLSLSAFFLTVIAVLATGHAIVYRNAWYLIVAILLVGFLFIIQYLATHSHTIKRRK